MRGYLHERPRGHAGLLHYRMEWFGLEVDAIPERFAEYRERFAVDSNPRAPN